MSQHRNETFSSAIIKYIDYGTEEYIKQLCDGIGSGKVASVRPYIGSIIYPGVLFPTVGSNAPTQQFQDTTYVGYMEMVFPDATSPIDDLPAFTVLQFELDGVRRTFLTVAGGDVLAGGTKFSDFVASLYPDANQPVPFNPSALHVVRDITIQGGKFNVVGDDFVNEVFISGSHTVDYQFCIAVSGYAVIIQ